ncbi:MAG: type II toxin-antitoxin system PemK/MazF family toxin [Deltaproteobacteria bacterium]|nr:type II toxin-antitoxin system PemK/MazF family toxin [Deltaproteobacteria bacterium]
MVIRQGDVFWAWLGPPGDSSPAGRRPVVVVQSDLFNRTRINTVVVAAVTSNLKLAALPGNVRLKKGEAGLPKPCVVNVTQLASLDRTRLGEKLGSLSAERLRAVLGGIDLVIHGMESTG